MKKNKVIASVMSGFMALSLITAVPVSAIEPYISNPSFENEIDKIENQMYKAERTDEMAHDGKYSVKVGMERPEDPSQVPAWRYTSGKGSVNVIIRNVEPNTTYKVTLWVYNKTKVQMSTGVLDIEGQHTKSPWKLASAIESGEWQSTDGEWTKRVHSITTGPRTKELYAFAYTNYTGGYNGCGLFYVDDFSVEKVETKDVKEKASINYTIKDSKEFPETIPAIQKFEKADGTFRLNDKNQTFYTDEFSQSKTEYLAESMVKKGIIKNYTIKEIKDISKAKGIVVTKQPINFELPDLAKNSKIDAYQIDISNNKIVLYSDYIEGIQNGTMTLLQAFTQRKVLPAGSVHDYTDQVIRGLQVDSGRRYYSIDWLKEQVEQMAYYKQNKLQLRLKDNEGIRYDSKVAAPFVNEKAGYWTQEEVDDLINHAAKFNIEVIPEIDFPGHAEQDAFFYPKWALADSSKALDFTKQEVRDYMINVYKEAADFFHAKTIHIGGDEFFESGCTQNGRDVLKQWIREETGNENANEYDALKLFFNEAAEELFKKDLKVLVWNDNIKDLNGAVPLNKDIIVDFWAGGFYGSITASKAAAEGFNIMSSSSSNYHDLWPKNDKNMLDRPLPKDTYEQFTRYNYSKGSSYYKQDEVLTKDLDKSLGQMFPIWDDAHGYVPEYILSRTLYPRYATFALKTWGADYTNPMDYAEFERLIFTLESPVSEVREQVQINYNTQDLALITLTMKEALEAKITETTGRTQEKAEEFYDVVDEVLRSVGTYRADTWAAFEEALALAKAVMDDENATQNDIDAAAETLNNALNGLVIVKADKELLEAAIKTAESKKETDYTKASWKTLQAALEYAKEVLASDDGNPTQQVVNEATKALNDAITGLVKRPNKFGLQYFINQAKDKVESDYTPESWAPFAEALEIAIKINEDDSDELTQQEVNTAQTNLYKAMRALVMKGTTTLATTRTLASSTATKEKGKAKGKKVGISRQALRDAIREAELINPERFCDEYGFTTEIIKELIYRFENLDYEENGKFTINDIEKKVKKMREEEF